MVSKTWEMWTLSKEDIDNVAENFLSYNITTEQDYDEIARIVKKEIHTALDNWTEIIKDAIIEYKKRQR